MSLMISRVSPSCNGKLLPPPSAVTTCAKDSTDPKHLPCKSWQGSDFFHLLSKETIEAQAKLCFSLQFSYIK